MSDRPRYYVNYNLGVYDVRDRALGDKIVGGSHDYTEALILAERLEAA